MKFFKLFTLLLLSSVITFYACDDNTNAVRKKAEEKLDVAVPPAPSNATKEPAQNAEGVWHYICSKGCAGGAGAAGSCATCGSPLAHNAAYHDNAGSTSNNNTSTTPPDTPPASPAQNADGVWHYTCANGCAGGAGTAGTCSGCGGTLAHNPAYHQEG